MRRRITRATRLGVVIGLLVGVASISPGCASRTCCRPTRPGADLVGAYELDAGTYFLLEVSELGNPPDYAALAKLALAGEPGQTWAIRLELNQDGTYALRDSRGEVRTTEVGTWSLDKSSETVDQGTVVLVPTDGSATRRVDVGGNRKVLWLHNPGGRMDRGFMPYGLQKKTDSSR